MGSDITRREAVLGLAASAGTLLGGAGRRESLLRAMSICSIPRVSRMQPDAPYKPAAYTLEDHLKLVTAAGLAHSVIVHPEPYQDDHRYLEYCFAHEPGPGYFKGTCMFDPLRADTPDRMRALAERWPKRIIALRIHEMSMTYEANGADPPARHERSAHGCVLGGGYADGHGGPDAVHTGAGARDSPTGGEVF